MTLRYFVNNFLEIATYAFALLVLLQQIRYWWSHKWFRCLLLLAGCNFFTIGTASYLTLSLTPNLFWYDLSGLARLLSTMLLFITLAVDIWGKRLVWITGLGTAFMYTTLWLEVNDKQALFSWGLGLVYGVIVLWCIHYLYTALKNWKSGDDLFRQPSFVVVCGLFIYHGAAYIILIAYRYLTLLQMKMINVSQPRPRLAAGDLWGLYSVIVAFSWLAICSSLLYFRKREAIMAAK